MNYAEYRANCINMGTKPRSKANWTALLATLKRAAKLTKVENIHWRDQHIYLDGYHFRGCRFDNCKLTFKTTSYKLERCHIGSDCTIEAAA